MNSFVENENSIKKNFTLDELERYKRHLSLKEIGYKGQLKLKKSSVLFIGAGGIGSSALIYVAAAGIGKIGIADNDLVETSNLQRQVIHSHLNVGSKKVDSAKETIKELNPHCEIKTYKERINSSNILKIIQEYDLICDCSDNFGTRYLINDACLIIKKPFIFGSVQGFQGQVAVFNLNKNSPNLRDLLPYSPSNKDIPSCSEFGVIGVSTGLIGILQANEIIKIIASQGDVLDGKILNFDLLTLSMKKLNLKPDFKNKQINNLSDFSNDYEDLSALRKEITCSQLEKKYKKNRDQIIVIDVREKEEFNKLYLEGSISLPLSIFEDSKSLKIIKKNCFNKEIFTLCKSGKRSIKATQILNKLNIESKSIAGGIEQLKEFNTTFNIIN